MIQKTSFVLALLVIVACAHTQLPPVSPREKALYETGLRAQEDKDFKKSEEAFNSLLQEFPTTRWLSNAYYYLGLGFQEQGKCPEAVEKFSKVVDFQQGVHTREEAEALYHMAVCYDSMNNDEKQVLILLQMSPGLKYLPREVAEAEWPARLAAAYARQGLSTQATEYSALAEKGLKKVKASGKPNVQRWLPKTYFSMGHIAESQMTINSKEDLERFFNVLDNSQGWLILAAESKSQPWSSKASEELLEAYTKIWDYVEKMPQPNESDAMLAVKKRQQNQRALATRVDTLLQNLRTLKSPATSEDSEEQGLMELFKRLGDIQKKVDILIGQRDVQDQNLKKVRGRKKR